MPAAFPLSTIFEKLPDLPADPSWLTSPQFTRIEKNFRSTVKDFAPLPTYGRRNNRIWILITMRRMFSGKSPAVIPIKRNYGGKVS